MWARTARCSRGSSGTARCCALPPTTAMVASSRAGQPAGKHAHDVRPLVLQLYAGGSIGGAVKLNYGNADVVINWSGGLHHAKKAEARPSLPCFGIFFPSLRILFLSWRSSFFPCARALPEEPPYYPCAKAPSHRTR